MRRCELHPGDVERFLAKEDQPTAPPAYAIVLERFPTQDNPSGGGEGRSWYYACGSCAIEAFMQWADIVPLAYVKSPVEVMFP